MQSLKDLLKIFGVTFGIVAVGSFATAANNAIFNAKPVEKTRDVEKKCTVSIYSSDARTGLIKKEVREYKECN